MPSPTPAEPQADLRLQDLNIASLTPLPSPRAIKEELPVPAATARVVYEGREAVQRILAGSDPRLLAVVGPCSIHDPAAALEYAQRLRELQGELADRLCILMRVYFEKPRTRLGWKGLINDPHLNGSYDIPTGLRLARRLLVDINGLGLPVASEMLDPISAQYTADLVAWCAIGARTTESQTHREMASGLSMPVGFKNSTDGNLQNAIDALLACRSPHCFLGIDQDGAASVVQTTGNRHAHLVLRGGRDTGPNYDAASLNQAVQMLQACKLPPCLMIDCSHGNSNKKYEEQPEVLRQVVAQRCEGNRAIVGVMLESFLEAGAQPIPADLGQLRYGLSVTDACLDWGGTAAALREAAARLG